MPQPRFRGQHLIPTHMQEGLARYLFDGIAPGGFLSAILANDLVQAFGRSDAINEEMMWHWASWLYNYAPAYPAKCWGSYEQIDWWCLQGGAKGLGFEDALKEDN